MYYNLTTIVTELTLYPPEY